MRINLDQHSLDMEERDLNYILPAYIRSYLFNSKNIDPVKIVFPMFRSVPHPTKPGVAVPIEWVPEDSPVAVEIIQDGKNVKEATEAEIAEKDKADDVRKEALGQEPTLEQLVESTPEPEVAGFPTEEVVADVSPARAAFAEVATKPPAPPREPKGPPSGPIIPPGTPLDNMAPRNRGDQKRIAKDLLPEPDVEEDKEVEAEIEKPKE